MFDYSGFFTDIKGLIITLIELYIYVILIRAVISWFNPNPHNPLVQLLRGVTDPALNAVRSFVPRFLWSTGVDFTPLVLIVLLWLVISFLQNFLPTAA